MIGLGVGIFTILLRNYNVPFSFSEKIVPGEPIEIKLSENVTFLNKASILETLKAIPAKSEVILDATESHYIHPDVIDIIKDFEMNALSKQISITIKGDFDEVNFDHVDYFMRKVSKDGKHKTPYLEVVFNK